MADTKISALTPGSPAVATDMLPARRGAGNVSLLLSDLLALFMPAPGAIGGGTPAAGTFTALAATTVTASSLVTQAAENALTAFAGGGKGSATPLSATKNVHRVSTVATAADSVLMPAALAGQIHFVRNDGAAAMQVFGQGTDTINGVATATGVSQAAGVATMYACAVNGAWTTTAIAAGSFDPTQPGAIGGTTPSTGKFTQLNVADGTAGSGTASIFSTSTPTLGINFAGGVTQFIQVGVVRAAVGSNFNVGNVGGYNFSGTTTGDGSADTGVWRKAAKITEFNTGTSGGYVGTAFGNGLQTVAQLPTASTCAGFRACVSDASTPIFGATVTGGGAVVTPVYSDGTAWKVG